MLLAAALAVLTLAVSPTMVGGNQGPSQGGPNRSGTYSPSLVDDAPAVGAIRNDPRNSGFDRALRNRQPLLAVLGAMLLLVAALAHRRSVLAAHPEHPGTAQSSPYSGRAPPALPVLRA